MKYVNLIIGVISIIIVIYYVQKPTIEGVTFREKCMVDGLNRNNIVVNSDNKLISNHTQNIYYGSHFNSKKGDKNCNDKIVTNKLLKNANISVPESYIWNTLLSTSTNLYNINKLKYPLVVKPNKGTQGYGITTNIKNESQLLNAINPLLNKQHSRQRIIIEEHYHGDNYRIMVFNKEIMGIVKRDNPYVIGDGTSRLNELIKQHKTSKYKIHEIDVPYIKSQGVHLNSIIPNNEKIIVSKVNNYHNGAPIYNIPLHKVHPDNITMFKKTAQVLGINLTGIDYMTKNLMVPHYTDGIIIEANERPDLAIHCDSSTTQENNNFIDKFLNLVFKN